MKNKKGQAGIVWLFVILGVILILAFVSALILGSLNWASSVITPITTDFGVVEGANLSQTGQQTFGILNTILGLLPLIVGVGYFVLLVGCIVLVISYRTTMNPIWMGMFFVFIILLILISILMSNAYQDLYEANDVIATQLQSMTLLSFLILNSPYIFGVIAFISGIFLFTGKQAENVGSYGYG